jgi:parvulin-like peptidyl-prolyl isomerase
VTPRKSGRQRDSVSEKSIDTGSKPFWIGIGWIAVGVVLLAYLAYAVTLYFTDLTDGFTRFWTTIFYYPAASVLTPGYLGWFLLSLLPPLLVFLGLGKLVFHGVKGKALTQKKLVLAGGLLLAGALGQIWLPPVSDASVGYGEYLNRLNALQQFQTKRQELQPGQTAPVEELKTQGLSQLITQGDIIRQIATKLGVSVSQKEVDDFYKQMAERNQGEANLKKQLKEFLGWSPAEFKAEIRLRLLQEKINEKLAKDDKINKDRKEKAEGFLKRVKAGEDFATVAKESDDPTAAAGGDQGVVKKGEIDPAIETEAFKLEAGKTSDIIKTDRGYVIIQVYEKPAPDQLKVRQITVRTKSLNEYVPDELKKTKVSIYVKNLYWDKNLYAVQSKKQSNQPAPTGTESPAVQPAASTAP